LTVPRTRRQRGYRADSRRHDSPEEREHAQHAEELAEILKEDFDIEPEKCIPTGDGRGYVRLTFAQVEKLIYEDES
jgi:hypothetical protein